MPTGPKPRPTKLKLLMGEKNKQRINQQEAKPRPAIPKPPKHLSKKAKIEYKRMAKELFDLGLLTTIDGTALAAYCDLYAQWAEASELLQQSGLIILSKDKIPYTNPIVHIVSSTLKQMKQYLTEFGMTPSSRSRIKAEKPQDPEDDF